MLNSIQYFNGNIHNNESKRPSVGIACRKCSPDWKQSKDIYTLINILTNGGKYDIYVVKNNRTGKISKTARIVSVMTVSITDYSEKIIASVTDGAGNIDFQELRTQLENSGIATIKKALVYFDSAKAGSVADGLKLFSYMFNEMTGKLKGIPSIGTSCKLNPACKLNQSIKGSICEHCYADTMRKTVAYKLALNTLVLCTWEFPYEMIGIVPASKLRFESFSDLFNETQIVNYLNIAKKNTHLNSALWTKRPELLHRAIVNRFNGTKPENLSVVVSSLFVNTPIDIKGKYMLADNTDMVDHVFTVYTADYAYTHNINVQCGKSICIVCGLCYSRKTEYYINEVIKDEQPKYYKLINQ